MSPSCSSSCRSRMIVIEETSKRSARSRTEAMPLASISLNMRCRRSCASILLSLFALSSMRNTIAYVDGMYKGVLFPTSGGQVRLLLLPNLDGGVHAGGGDVLAVRSPFDIVDLRAMSCIDIDQVSAQGVTRLNQAVRGGQEELGPVLREGERAYA